ncbi:hypothetical protein [Chitinophaga nivalis]|uniref:Uncharacterized protein n=1 Tax=Chitinophaga nivalis TaxID=2991709 RepID=A0ABT3IJC7_9BACT|nr:hypothetical protein [Chitinophaga nivalis]MCW3466260.1 hypothetical protein [Chitinophaga nivalis]MCW3484049.1 hypothetical protein [Chitinophaga nivalis]
MKKTKISLIILLFVALISGTLGFKLVGANPPESLFYVNKSGQLFHVTNCTRVPTGKICVRPAGFSKGFYTTSITTSTTPTFSIIYGANAQ